MPQRGNTATCGMNGTVSKPMADAASLLPKRSRARGLRCGTRRRGRYSTGDDCPVPRSNRTQVDCTLLTNPNDMPALPARRARIRIMSISTRRRRAIAALALLLPLLPACRIANQRYSTPHTEGFGLVAGQLEAGGLAFLTPSSVTGQEEDRQPLALVFADVLAERRKDIPVVGLPQTLSAVNRAGLTEAYKRMYQDYRDSGVF